jgi:polygalacturonase
MQMFPSKVGTNLSNNIIYNDIPGDSIHNSYHCENLKFCNVRIWNFTMLELKISQCENLKFHNVRTWNFTMWKPEISQCKNLKFHNVKTWNFTIWELKISQCENLKFHNVTTWNFSHLWTEQQPQKQPQSENLVSIQTQYLQNAK